MRPALLVTGLLLLLASGAAAQSPPEAAADIRSQGFHLDPVAVVVSESALREVATATADAGAPVYPVVLGADAAAGNTLFAEQVLADVGGGTVIVLTDALGVGVASTDFDSAELSVALDAADAAGGDNLTYLLNLVEALTGVDVDVSGVAVPPGGDGGIDVLGLIVLVLVVGGLLAAVVLAVRRAGVSSFRARKARLQEIVDEMADDILALADAVEASPRAKQHFVDGTAVFTEAAEQVERAERPDDIDGLQMPLLEAAWHLDAAEAILKGDPVPPKPAAPQETPDGRAVHRGEPVETAPAPGARAGRLLSVLAGAGGLRRRARGPRRATRSLGSAAPPLRGRAGRRRRGGGHTGSTGRKRRE